MTCVASRQTGFTNVHGLQQDFGTDVRTLRPMVLYLRVYVPFLFIIICLFVFPFVFFCYKKRILLYFDPAGISLIRVQVLVFQC